MQNPTSSTAFTQPTTTTISARIRASRKARSLTLHDIERLSNGSIKAVVMGSYERGTRAISLSRTIEIANLFQIPVTELIQEPTNIENEFDRPLLFDLRKVAKQVTGSEECTLIKLDRYLKAIAARRRDWNGEVMTLRGADFDTLTLLFEKSGPEVLRIFREHDLLVTALNPL